MNRFRPRTLRTRLTAWYVAMLAAILVLYGGGISVLLAMQLREQLDHHAIEELETLEGYLYFLPDGKLHLRTDYHDHPYPAGERGRFIEVRSEDGAIAYRSEALGSRLLDGMPQPDEGRNTYSPRSVHLPGGPRVRLISRRHRVDGKPMVIRLALSEEHLWETFYGAVLGLFVGAPFALSLAGVGGYFLAKRALRPIGAMARRAQEINAERLNARLIADNPDDEVGQLAAAFNDTLGRLEHSFGQLRRFTSDAAHELRTPLTAIRSVGEVGLQKPSDPAKYRETIESMLEESDRLRLLVEGLLSVARADAGQVRLERSVVPALEQAREVSVLLDVLAEEKGQSVSVAGDDGVHADADRVVFRQILINLLDNAIKYSPPGGHISVHVGRKGDMVLIDVCDSGPGIGAEHRERVFDRFYRVDSARSRDTGGAGLGLSIAKWGAEAHGGSLQLLPSSGPGSTFRLLVPIAASVPALTSIGTSRR